MGSGIWAWCWTLLCCSFALSTVSTTSAPRCIAPIYKSHRLSGTDEGQLCATLDTRYETWQTVADVAQSAMSQWHLPQTVRLRAESFLHTRHAGCARVHQVPTQEVFFTSIAMHSFQAKTESQSGPIGGRLRVHFAASQARYSKCFQCLLGRMCRMWKMTDQDVAFRVTVLGLVIDCKNLMFARSPVSQSETIVITALHR